MDDANPFAAELEDILDRVGGLTGEIECEWHHFVTWEITHQLPVGPWGQSCEIRR
ncbi:hypothetical protein SAMN05421776_101447 [Nocardia farcinica]|uniref:Uncharacterized protein n=1 Tax=Nocardia farcinica TaxID=37329 RepID=A0A0H5NI62_NOCFR|nr:hypothetical protein [Nocardia farcinica]MBA4854299.1 hypothetical protein [Nocardia farcinica]MBC9814484.1 hypothetical protein [Nocardia farcinica]MBF6270782.1 hypothetical protein [Nocardia farcinica]MCZ9329679.1 hypothetical protein [Nocardia farcinica]PFW98301.1 hypothetical protein CJ469_06358 [Nocardia farcinica]